MPKKPKSVRAVIALGDKFKGSGEEKVKMMLKEVMRLADEGDKEAQGVIEEILQHDIPTITDEYFEEPEYDSHDIFANAYESTLLKVVDD